MDPRSQDDSSLPALGGGDLHHVKQTMETLTITY